MTKLTPIILALTMAVAAGCATGDYSGASETDDPSTRAEARFDDATGNSLYALRSGWVSQDGVDVQLADLGGQPIIISMVYTNCRYACPIIVHDMKRIDRELPPDLAADVRYVLVSLDPERDDPDALAQFARSYGLDPDRWTLLQGDPSDVRMLATALGVKYRKAADGQYSHTNLVAVLNGKGEILHREIDPGGESSSMLAALRGEANVTSL